MNLPVSTCTMTVHKPWEVQTSICGITLEETDTAAAVGGIEPDHYCVRCNNVVVRPEEVRYIAPGDVVQLCLPATVLQNVGVRLAHDRLLAYPGERRTFTLQVIKMKPFSLSELPLTLTIQQALKDVVPAGANVVGIQCVTLSAEGTTKYLFLPGDLEMGKPLYQIFPSSSMSQLDVHVLTVPYVLPGEFGEELLS